MTGKKTVLAQPTSGFKIRQNDDYGSGAYGASRGKRKHAGIDVEVVEGESIKSPINGIVNRYPQPYLDDNKYKGIEIVGTGEDSPYKIKIFYMIPTLDIDTVVSRGTVVGKAQDIDKKYESSSRNMINHVHLELYKNGERIDPTSYFVAD